MFVFIVHLLGVIGLGRFCYYDLVKNILIYKINGGVSACRGNY